MKKFKREVEEKLKLITEGVKEGKSKAIAACENLDKNFQEYSKEGVGLATIVETLGVDLRTRTKQLESEGVSTRKKCVVRFHSLRTGFVHASAWKGQAVSSTQEGVGFVPHWLRWKVSGWEDGIKSRRRLGGSRSSRFRHGDK